MAVKIDNWAYPTGVREKDEGWFLHSMSGRIRMNPNHEPGSSRNAWPNVFDTDEEAYAHVQKKAEAGSEIHQEALYIHSISKLCGQYTLEQYKGDRVDKRGGEALTSS